MRSSAAYARAGIEGALEALEPRFAGRLVRRGEGEYDQARRLWGGATDQHPIVIARCATTIDVARCTQLARAQGLPIAVRGGGRYASGFASVTDSLVIDLSPLKGIAIDATARTARAEAGLTAGELIRALQARGLIVPTGISAGAGIAGSTLGGGIGWLASKHGLTIDAVRELEIVTAAGQILAVNAERHAGLFWGLRGGGGNFGVVTAFTYRLQPLGPILGGRLIHPLSQAREALRHYHAFNQAAPDDVAAYAFLVTLPSLGPALLVMAGYFGDDLGEGERLLAPLREFGPPLADQIQPMAYADFVGLFDMIAPSGRRSFEPAYALSKLSDGAIDSLVTWAGRMSSPLSAILLHPLRGAAARVAPDATAFARREPHYIVVHNAAWDEGPAEPHQGWAIASTEAMAPFASPGLSIDFMGPAGDRSVRDAYRDNYGRLAELKRSYDPANLFRLNPNIPPWPPGAAAAPPGG